MGYSCVPSCTEERVEIYLPDSDVAYTIVKAGFAGSIQYRDSEVKVSAKEKEQINREKEAWCPIHGKVLKWSNP